MYGGHTTAARRCMGVTAAATPYIVARTPGDQLYRELTARRFDPIGTLGRGDHARRPARAHRIATIINDHAPASAPVESVRRDRRDQDAGIGRGRSTQGAITSSVAA